MERKGRYEYFKSNDGWHVNKISSNGEITMVSEAFVSKGNAIAAIGRDMEDSSHYDIVEKPQVEIEKLGVNPAKEVRY